MHFGHEGENSTGKELTANWTVAAIKPHLKTDDDMSVTSRCESECSSTTRGAHCRAGSQPFPCVNDTDCAGFPSCAGRVMSCVQCASKTCKHAECGIKGAHAGTGQVCVRNFPCTAPAVPPPPPGYSNATVTRVPIMMAGSRSVGCTFPGSDCVYKAFRIPGMVLAGNTLLAFAEDRATGCGDFSGYHDM